MFFDVSVIWQVARIELPSTRALTICVRRSRLSLFIVNIMLERRGIITSFMVPVFLPRLQQIIRNW